MRRWLLGFLVLVFLAASFGCQKRFRVVQPSAYAGGYDKYAHVIIDICDPAVHEKRFSEESDFRKEIRYYCAAGMRSLEIPLNSGKIQDEKLKNLILRYKEFKLRKKEN